MGNNGTGVAGVNWATQIMGLKFLDASGSGSMANAVTVIDFAIQAKQAGQNVRVLSNSWGGGGFTQTYSISSLKLDRMISCLLQPPATRDECRFLSVLSLRLRCL